MGRARARFWVPLLVMAAVAGCKKDPPQEQSAPSGAAVAGAATSEPAARRAEALARIPVDSLMVAVSGPAEDVLTRLGRKQVADALGSDYAMAAAAVTLATGHDLLDPAAWAGIGIDPKKPVGVAWLDARDEAGVVFASVSDAAKLRSFVEGGVRRMGGELTEEKVGDATVLGVEGTREALAVLTKDAVYVVFTDRRSADTRAYASAIARQSRDGALASSPRFVKALDGLAFGRDLTVWVDVPRIVAEVQRHVAKRPEDWAPPKHMEMELSDARASGDAAAVQRAEQAIAQRRSDHERWRRRDAAELELLEAALGGLDGVAMGAEVDGEAIRVKAWSTLRDGSTLAKLLRGGEEVPAVLRSLTARPLFATGGVLDPATALAVAHMMARADGEDLDAGFDEARDELGFDPRTELYPVLDGRAGFAMTGDVAQIVAAGRDGERLLGGTLTLGVTDAQKARAALQKLWELKPLLPLVSQDKANGTARLAIPKWRDVHVAVVGDTIVATTDADALGRLAKEGRGALLEAEKGAVGSVLGDAKQSGFLALDGRLVALLFLSGSGDWDPPEASPPADPSAEWTAKRKELEAAQARARELRKKREDLQNRAALEVSEVLGLSAASARVEGGALVVQAAQSFGAPSVPAAAARITRTVMETQAQSKATRKQMWDAEDEVDKLRNELARLGEQDRARAVERLVPPPPLPPVVAP